MDVRGLRKRCSVRILVLHDEVAEPLPQEPHTHFFAVRTRNVRKALKALDEDKSTGPDRLAGKLLKRCAETLALPVAKLTRKVLHEGTWPTLWKQHWLCALHKKRSTFDPSNYRGVHLTPVLSKVVERVLGEGFLGFLECLALHPAFANIF